MPNTGPQHEGSCSGVARRIPMELSDPTTANLLAQIYDHPDMNAISTTIPDVVLLEPSIHTDDRGSFYESYNRSRFAEIVGIDPEFIQDNHSESTRGVLRGLHYQAAPHAQGKLVRVIAGSVFDVAVDLRKSSATFAKWVGAELSAANHRQLWVPEGFAHGFLVLSERATVLYKTTDYYSRADDKSICWNDPDIGVDWPIEAPPILSAKDLAAPRLKDVDAFD